MTIFTRLFSQQNQEFFGKPKGIFFAKKKGEGDSEQESGRENRAEQEIVEIRNLIDGIVGGEKDAKREDADRIIQEIENFYKKNTPEKVTRELLGFILNSAEMKKSPARNNLADLVGKNEEQEFKNLTKAISEMLKKEDYLAQLNAFKKKQDEGVLVILEKDPKDKRKTASKEILSLQDAHKRVRDDKDPKRELIQEELLTHERAKAYQCKLFEQKFILKQLIIKATEDRYGIDPNNAEIIKNFFEKLQNEIAIQNVHTIEDKRFNAIRDVLRKTLEGESNAQTFGKKIKAYDSEAIVDMENIILSLNAEQISTEIFGDIKKKNLAKRATLRNNIIRTILKKKEKIKKLEKENENKDASDEKIQENEKNISKIKKEVSEDYLGLQDFANQEELIGSGNKTYSDIYGEYGQLLFEDWKKDEISTAKDESEVLTERKNILENYEKLDSAQRKEMYLNSKKYIWEQKQKRQNAKITEPNKETVQKWEKEYENSSENKRKVLYFETAQEDNLEKKYSDFEEVSREEFEFIKYESDLEAGREIIGKLISESSQKSQILDCVENDPNLGKMAVSISNEIYNFFVESEKEKELSDPKNNPKNRQERVEKAMRDSEKVTEAYGLISKVQVIFAQMHEHISERVKEVHEMESVIKKEDAEHETEIKKIQDKIKDKQNELLKAQEEKASESKIQKLQSEIEKLNKEEVEKENKWKNEERKEKLSKTVAEKNKWKDRNGNESYTAYKILAENVYKEDEEKNTGWSIDWNRFFTIEEMIKGVKNMIDAWKKQREGKMEYHAGEFANIFVLGSKEGTLGKQIENKIYNQQLSYWKDELENRTPAMIEAMFDNESPELANKACFFVAIGLLVGEANFGKGWKSEHIANLIQKYPRSYPPQVKYNGKMISFKEDPYHYMDTVFGQSGWAAGLERKQAMGLEGLFDSTHKALLAKFTTPPSGQTQKSICEDIVNFGHQQMNSYQLAGAFKAARDHKQEMFKPIDEILQVSKILKKQGDAPGPVNQAFTHSLCGSDRDRHPFLDYFIVNNSDPNAMKEGFRLLRDDPNEYIRRCAIPAAVKRLSSKAASIEDLSKLTSAEGGVAILLLDKAAFEGWISETNHAPKAVAHDRIQDFLKLTNGNGKRGKMWDSGIDWANAGIEKETGYRSLDEMIQNKRKKILESQRYRHLEEAVEFGGGPGVAEDKKKKATN